MIVVCGLGNPGDRYAHTRHNIGFMVVDALAKEWQAAWSHNASLNAYVTTADVAGERVILVKPQTFMNESGSATSKVMHYYKAPAANLWAIFDDLDQPFGQLRIRRGGSSGGHQGVRSLIAHHGEDFWRFKVGISLNDRTRESSEVYVLKSFNSNERPYLDQVVSGSAEAVKQAIVDQPTDTTVQLAPEYCPKP